MKVPVIFSVTSMAKERDLYRKGMVIEVHYQPRYTMKYCTNSNLLSSVSAKKKIALIVSTESLRN